MEKVVQDQLEMARPETSGSPNRWDLNPIVLHHTHRFFNAVSLVIHRWTDPDRELLDEVAALLGNILWAQSAYITSNKVTEESLALAGALSSTVARKLNTSEGTARWLALEIVSRRERAVIDHTDQLLDALVDELESLELTPGEVNRWIWERLFPTFPHDLSQSELQDAIRRHLEG